MKLHFALSAAASLLLISSAGAAVAAEPDMTIEQSLNATWQYFKEGDVNKDGYWSEAEFNDHPGYKEEGFERSLKTFIFWMVDDNKDSRISLQEWFNNEIGQFQMGDTDHDGVMTAKEHDGLDKIENKLFADLKSK